MAVPATEYCSFCGKSRAEVKHLIAGPAVFICDECSLLCADIVRTPRISGSPRDCPATVIEVRRRKDGTLDEIVAGKSSDDNALFVHLEQMDKQTFWLGVSNKGYRQVTWITARRNKLEVKSEMDSWPPLTDGKALLRRLLAIFNANRDRLVDQAEGRYALVHERDGITVHETYEGALAAGYGEYGPGEFLVKKIEQTDAPVRM